MKIVAEICCSWIRQQNPECNVLSMGWLASFLGVYNLITFNLQVDVAQRVESDLRDGTMQCTNICVRPSVKLHISRGRNIAKKYDQCLIREKTTSRFMTSTSIEIWHVWRFRDLKVVFIFMSSVLKTWLCRCAVDFVDFVSCIINYIDRFIMD